MPTAMHDFLSGLHERLTPRSYLEIGIRDGQGLALSSTRTIGVDPDYDITVELACELQLVRATSDAYFASGDPLAWFGGTPVDLALIDGMHRGEYALRDFMGTERLSSRHGVIVMDDMLPRSSEEAARQRQTREWAGDVFKVGLMLEEHRPELVAIFVDTAPTGVLLAVGLDPMSSVLAEKYDELLPVALRADPQEVPERILKRTEAADPSVVLGLPIWSALVDARNGDAEAAASLPELLDQLRSTRGTAHATRQS